MNKQELIQKLKASNQLVIELDAEDEYDSPYNSQFSITKDADDAKRYASAVNAIKRRSPLWGWCVAKVTVKSCGLDSADYLGNCSYKSKKDFIENSGYYQDMVDNCISEIADTLLCQLTALQLA